MAGDLIPWAAENREDEITATTVVSTYTEPTRENQIALYRAMQRSDKSLDDSVGEEITVQHIVCHRVVLVKPDTGETYEGIRTVMIAPDGTRYGTVSNVVRGDLRRAEACLGVRAPWNPPLRFKVCKYPSRQGGMKYLSLELLG